MGEVGFATFLVSFYFICEVLPLLVVFLQHRKDFSKCELEIAMEPLLNKSSDSKPVLKNSLIGSTQVYTLDRSNTNTTTSVIEQTGELRVTEVLRNEIDDGLFEMREPGLLNLRLSVVNNLRQTVPDDKYEVDAAKKHSNLSTGAHTQEYRRVQDEDSVDESIDSEEVPDFHDIS